MMVPTAQRMTNEMIGRFDLQKPLADSPTAFPWSIAGDLSFSDMLDY